MKRTSPMGTLERLVRDHVHKLRASRDRAADMAARGKRDEGQDRAAELREMEMNEMRAAFEAVCASVVLLRLVRSRLTEPALVERIDHVLARLERTP